MSCQIGINQFFGANPFIKLLNSDIVAVDGPNTIERLIAGDIKIPYAQVLKGHIVLKPGQLAYLMNHLGLGDNATFVAIIARYDIKSVNEEDNYLEYYYTDDTGKIRYMDQMMILTGNSAKRIPQLYFNNPNDCYKVTLDVMVASIDDTYTFFPDTVDQSGLSFFNLQCNLTQSNIETFIVGESIVINEITIGKVFLEFITESDAKQALSLINYVSNNTGVVIQDLSPIVDIVSPIAYFYQQVGNTSSGSYIEFNGLTATSYDTSYGVTFSTSIVLSDYDTITKNILSNIIIEGVNDNRDGIIIMTDTNLIIENYLNIAVDSIATTGTYSLSFNVSDIAGNSIDTNTKITLSII